MEGIKSEFDLLFNKLTEELRKENELLKSERDAMRKEIEQLKISNDKEEKELEDHKTRIRNIKVKVEEIEKTYDDYYDDQYCPYCESKRWYCHCVPNLVVSYEYILNRVKETMSWHGYI
jgi:predicted nuclease with TOPRIM domain